jgi:23S rRNA pseudouridine1911/1915/1917 synthase
VHLAAVGLPVAGDPVYGRRGRTPQELSLARPALHAEQLGFTHPRSGAWLAFAAPMPADLADLLRELERRESAA